MKRKAFMPFFIQRLLESIGITLLASCLISMIMVVEDTIATKYYVIGLMGEALIFLALNFFLLRDYLVAVERVGVYLRTNLFLFVLQAAASVAGSMYLPNKWYLLFWGFTRIFTAYGMPKMISSAIFWGVYLVEIIFFPIDRALVQREINRSFFDI